MRPATSPTSSPSVFDAISAFTASAEGMADLRVVKAVDETVDVLCAVAKFYRAHATTGRSIVADINGLPVKTGEFQDPNGEAESGLDEMIDRSEAYLSGLTAKKGYIDRDKGLSSAHCDMLHTAYDDALLAIALTIEVAKDMRAAIIAHDLASEPRDGRIYPTVEALRSEIRH